MSAGDKLPDDVRAMFKAWGAKGGKPSHKREIPAAKRKAIAKKAARARWAKPKD